jgi:DNA-binding XRE family transcriptional regulator
MTAARSHKHDAPKWATEFRQFRRRFLYRQSDLAHALGCVRRTVYGIESGETENPRYDLLRRFCDLKERHLRGENPWLKQVKLPNLSANRQRSAARA